MLLRFYIYVCACESMCVCVRVKCILMGIFLVCVGRIVCGGQGRDIVYFLTETQMTRKRYVHWKLL